MRLNFSVLIIRYIMQFYLRTSVLKILPYVCYIKYPSDDLQLTEYYRDGLINCLLVYILLKKFIILTIRNALLRKYT